MAATDFYEINRTACQAHVRVGMENTLNMPTSADLRGHGTRLNGKPSTFDQKHNGSILLLVLVVIAMLTLGTATYLELMQSERKAVRHHGRGAQAVRLAESGAEYVKTLLAMTPADLQQAGGLTNNAAKMSAMIVDDQEADFERGRFTIMAPAQADGAYSGAVRFGLENESAKLNVNTLLAQGAEDQATNRLMALPGMTPPVADAILDWLDADTTPRANGCEQDYYSQLDPPYAPRNGPIAALDELLLVRGVTPELLYGADQNRNYAIDLNESPRGALAELNIADGSMNCGWSAYLTVWSVEGFKPLTAKPAVDLNGQNLQQLHTDLQASIGDDKAKFIVIYRQYGPQPQQQPGQGIPGGGTQIGGAASAGGAGAAYSFQSAGGNRGNGGGGNTGGNSTGGNNPQQQPVNVKISSVQLKFDQQGGTQINSPLDLVGVKVQIPGQNNGPPQVVDSPWTANPTSYHDLLLLYDSMTYGNRRVAGRVNINVASRPVLASIPGMPADAIPQIVSRREADPDLMSSDQRHAIWLLTEGIVTLDQMKPMERYITTRGDAFSGQAVGFFDAGPMAARGEFVVDRSGTTPHLRTWQDLTSLGRGFPISALGL
jgi:DNA uptake protein ComE-like DNA-binding protein